MKIGIVSDTHIPQRAKKLPRKLLHGLKGVDFIIHAGDWQTMEVYEQLNTIAPVDGVAGNVDGDDLHRKFGRKKIMRFQGYRIGVIHGDGKPRSKTEQRAIAAFSENPVHMIIYGHSHIPVKKEHAGMIIFNPGSPTDKRRQPKYSYGLLTIKDDLSVKHVYFS